MAPWPAAHHNNFWVHQYREFNQLADTRAKDAASGKSQLQWYNSDRGAKYLWVQMDGSLNHDGCGSSVAMWASTERPSPIWVEAEWTLAATISLQIEAQSVVQTELVAALLSFCLVHTYAPAGPSCLPPKLTRSEPLGPVAWQRVDKAC